MPPSKRKLKAQAAIAEAPHVKAAKARRARDHDADPDAAGERRHAHHSLVDAMSSMTALTKTEERG
jgi:hypothetical protein